MELTGVLADVQIALRVMPKAGHQYTFSENVELADFSATGRNSPISN
jgi:BioD-like phosphotransacetylase family protein